MRHPDLPTPGLRLQAAEVAGEVLRLAFGDLRGLPLAECVQRVQAITTDRVVLGSVLGPHLVQAERSQAYRPAVDILTAAGADPAAAEAKATWLREQYADGRIL